MTGSGTSVPEGTSDWPCPYCRARIPFDSASCTNCGAQLREADNDLFASIAAPVPSPGPTPPPVPAPPSAAATAEVVAQPPPGPAMPPHSSPVLESTIPVEDPHGLASVVAGLRQTDSDAAAVPLCVIGALLDSREVVAAAVVGQMLGQVAAVVLTDRRVLVANARRWEPIVDSFALGGDLVVRGRHDRHVALLTFSQGRRLSTVDGITDVGAALDLAELIGRR